LVPRLPPYTITTVSGRQLSLVEPDADVIALKDIAAALSKICRFGAQTREFYSVAQHAVLVYELVVEAGRSDLALAGLHHDSHEAFAGDIPTPLKHKIASETDVYKRVCDGLDIAIARALGLLLPNEGSADRKVIKAADEQAFQIEAARLVPNAVEAESTNPVPDLEEPWSPTEAEKAFFAAHRAASKLVRNA
jgi:hypothetical protein